MVTKLETLQAERGDITAAAQASRAVAVFDSFEAARADWAELYAICAASPYQSYQFVSTWFDTVGREELLEPFIIVARAPDGRPQALLPLALDSRGPLRIATFMCGRESNFNLGLFRPGLRLEEAGARGLLADAAREAIRRPDLYYLRNQPRRFEGVDNPFAFADARPSASFAYSVALPASAAELDARVSKDTRKKLRKKEARLRELGELRYEHRASGARALEIVGALIAQKSARLAERGVSSLFESAGMRDFLERLGGASGDGALEVHGLSLSGRIVATYAGLIRGGRFSALLNSFDMDEEIARCSPGDLLLHALMRDLVARGMSHFDLGAGEARYKNAVCDETIELCDALTPVTFRGALAAPALSWFLQVKRRIKQTPWMARCAARLRRRLAAVPR